jgi:aryl-alcohol dehydrogenase-like predicted oxidoreductase
VCRYIGITSTFHGAFLAVEAVLGREKPDFVQFDYSIDDREAEQRILPLAAEVKAAVLTGLPFGRGRLFRAVHGQGLLKCMHTSETAARVRHSVRRFAASVDRCAGIVSIR